LQQLVLHRSRMATSGSFQPLSDDPPVTSTAATAGKHVPEPLQRLTEKELSRIPTAAPMTNPGEIRDEGVQKLLQVSHPGCACCPAYAVLERPRCVADRVVTVAVADRVVTVAVACYCC
jgi:hypothetical protein